MRAPSPLPLSLAHRVFTRAQAMESGVSRQRLRADDILALGRGIYRHGPGPTDELQLLAAICAMHPGHAVGGPTIARILRLPLPPLPARDPRIHLIADNARSGRDLDPVDGRPVVLHRTSIRPGDLRTAKGIVFTSRARTWLDLGSVLAHEDLVAVGDHLVRQPRPGLEERTAAWNSLDGLATLVESHRGIRGVAALRRALRDVRVGADSPAESKLRLALVAAGLPEPELQVPLDPSNPRTDHADLGYRACRLALNYDGRVHDNYESKRRDRERDRRWEAARWTHLVFHEVDLRDGFRDAARRVREHLSRAA